MNGIERLRKWADAETESVCPPDSGDTHGKKCREFATCNLCRAFYLRDIADQIERETFPRPLFWDGKPVQWGDDVLVPCPDGDFCGELYQVAFDSDEVTLVNTDGELVYIVPGHRVKRPEPPKVLDGGGVPIEERAAVAGGAVWYTAVHGSEFTHKRPEPPDSWERLEKDVAKGDACWYFGIEDMYEVEGHECAGCKAYGVDMDCGEAMAVDVLRRCKSLAGVE